MKITAPLSLSYQKFLPMAEQALQLLKSQRHEYGFLDLPQQVYNEDWLRQVQNLKKDLLSFEQMLIVGIGGSGLGAKWLIDIKQADQRAKVLDNPEPILLSQTLKWIKDISKLVVVVISKSGATIETLSLTQICLPLLQAQGFNCSHQVLVVTEDQDQPLSNWAKLNNIRRFEVPLNVGGRYSILSNVGLLPALFLGYDEKQLLAGAQRALESDSLIIDLIAQSLASFALDHQVSAFWTYHESLKYFGDWFQQLWGESLGKPGSKSSIPLRLHSAQDQHSMLQLLMEGEFKIWTIFFIVERDNEEINYTLVNKDFPNLKWLEDVSLSQLLGAEQKATAQALKRQSKLVTEVSLPSLMPEDLGFLIMASELWVAGLGFALNINPFDQPGVELGKKLVKDLIKSS